MNEFIEYKAGRCFPVYQIGQRTPVDVIRRGDAYCKLCGYKYMTWFGTDEPDDFYIGQHMNDYHPLEYDCWRIQHDSIGHGR